MTTLTPNGLILESPIPSPHDYLELLQYKNYDLFIAHNLNEIDSLAWLNFEAEDYET